MFFSLQVEKTYNWESSILRLERYWWICKRPLWCDFVVQESEQLRALRVPCGHSLRTTGIVWLCQASIAGWVLWATGPWQVPPCCWSTVHIRCQFLSPQLSLQVVVITPSLLSLPTPLTASPLLTPEYCLFLVISLYSAHTFGKHSFPGLSSNYRVWECPWFPTRTWLICNTDIPRLFVYRILSNSIIFSWKYQANRNT